MSVCPCKDCADRKLSCHSTCPRYKKWRSEYDSRKEQENKERIWQDASWRTRRRRKL